MMTRRSHVGK